MGKSRVLCFLFDSQGIDMHTVCKVSFLQFLLKMISVVPLLYAKDG